MIKYEVQVIYPGYGWEWLGGAHGLAEARRMALASPYRTRIVEIQSGEVVS